MGAIKVTPSNETPSSLDFSKQELSELADFLRFARECANEYAQETSERNGRTFPMVRTLREYAGRAAELHARVLESIT